MLGSFLIRALILLLGYAYPAFECFKTLEKNKVGIEELRFWCQYWILAAFITVFEGVGEFLLSWLPMYGEAKLALFIYMWYPKTQGCQYIYESIVRPIVAKHETEIDRGVNEARAKAMDLGIYYWTNYSKVAQAKFFELLQLCASQSAASMVRPKPEGKRSE